MPAISSLSGSSDTHSKLHLLRWKIYIVWIVHYVPGNLYISDQF